MGSSKQKFLAELDKKTKKRQEARLQASRPKDLERYVFEYFRNLDNIKAMQVDWDTKMVVAWQAFDALINQVKILDPRVKNVKSRHINPGNRDDLLDVCGVTVEWSKQYCKRCNASPETYIDVTEMLLGC